MLRKLITSLVIFCVSISQVSAGLIHRGGGNTGATQVNVSANINGDDNGAFINAMKTAHGLQFLNGATPLQLDANGLPSAPLTSTQALSFNISFLSSQTSSATTWVVKWTPGGAAVLFFNVGWDNVIQTGCSVSTSAFTTTVTMTAATPCRVEFTFHANPGNDLQTQFTAASYAAGSNELILCRKTDEVSLTAGKITTPEYRALMAGLNPKTLRMMPWVNIGSSNLTNQAKWAYRTPATALGYFIAQFPPGVQGGTISGTDTYTGAAAPDTPGGWTAFEVYQGTFTNANTQTSVTGAVNNGSGLIRLTVNSLVGISNGTTINVNAFVGGVPAAAGQWVAANVGAVGNSIDLTGSTFSGTYTSGGTVNVVPTLNIGARGAKTIISAFGSALSAGTITAGSLATFVYDSILDKVLYTSGGVTGSVPIEAQVAVANELNVNLWTNIPAWADDTYVSSLTSYVRDNLKSSLNGYFEYSNEMWNGAFPPAGWATVRGVALGLTAQAYQGWYSLRTRQIMGNITTTWTASRSQASLRRVLAWQAFGDSGTKNFRLNSAELAPSGTSTGTGNALYSNYTGSANYTTQGQRAIDFADIGAYATYVSGGIFTNGSYSGSTSAVNIAALQTLATAFNSNPNDPTSLATLDKDIRQGTTNAIAISSVSGITINATANGFSNGNLVVFNGTIPAGLSAGTVYYVVNAATNSFSAAATFGGSAISVSGTGGTVGVLSGQTMLALSQYIYQNVKGNTSGNPGWEQVAATYDAYRTGVGQSLLSIELYEGGLENLAPTAAQCTAMGVLVGGSAATASAALAAGLVAYKNSSYGSALALALFNQAMGKDSTDQNLGLLPHSKVPSWFQVSGGGQWGLLPGAIDSTPYQTYNGVAAFH